MANNLVMYEEELKQITDVCDVLHRDSNAQAVLVIDKNGQAIAQHGEIEHLDVTSLSSLTAGNVAATGGIASLLSEKEFSGQFHEGERTHVHISIVNQRIMAIWHDQKRMRLPEQAWVYLRETVGGTVNPNADPQSQSELEHRMLEVCLTRARVDANPRHWQIFEANVLQDLDARTVALRYRTTTANVWVVRHRLIKMLQVEWGTLLNHPFNG